MFDLSHNLFYLHKIWQCILQVKLLTLTILFSHPNEVKITPKSILNERNCAKNINRTNWKVR